MCSSWTLWPKWPCNWFAPRDASAPLKLPAVAPRRICNVATESKQPVAPATSGHEKYTLYTLSQSLYNCFTWVNSNHFMFLAPHHSFIASMDKSALCLMVHRRLSLLPVDPFFFENTYGHDMCGPGSHWAVSHPPRSHAPSKLCSVHLGRFQTRTSNNPLPSRGVIIPQDRIGD